MNNRHPVKRKADFAEDNSSLRNVKRRLFNTTQVVSNDGFSNNKNSLGEGTSFKDRLKSFSDDNKPKPCSSRITNLRKTILGRDSPHNVENKLPFVGGPSNVTNSFSANNRLRLLRKSITNSSSSSFDNAAREKKNPVLSIQTTIKPEPISVTSSITSKKFEPFRPMTRNHTAGCDALTEYDDSQSAVDFGSVDGSSSRTVPLISNERVETISASQQVNLNKNSGLNNSDRSVNNQAEDILHNSKKEIANSSWLEGEFKSNLNGKPSNPISIKSKPGAYQNNATTGKVYSANSRLKLLRNNMVVNHKTETPKLNGASRIIPPNSFANRKLTDEENVIFHLGLRDNFPEVLDDRPKPFNVQFESLSYETTKLPFRKNQNNMNKTDERPKFGIDSFAPQFSSTSSCSASSCSYEISETESDATIPMEWNSIDENETILNLQTLRRDVQGTNELPHIAQTRFQETVAKKSLDMPPNMTILKEIYIVVDTNILISHLRTIKQVLSIKINGVETPIIMIPWMVIQELDYIKDGKSGHELVAKAREAIRFINYKLMHKDPFVKGQSVSDAALQEFPSKNPDDGILHCCTQIVKKRNKATLLSNDVNLRNKALIHGIPAHGHNTIINALDPYHQMNSNESYNMIIEDSRIKELKTYLSQACSIILTEVLKEEYTTTWLLIQPTDSPPWSLQRCIELFDQYWMPVFSRHINKQCSKLIKNFLDYLKSKQDGIIPIEDGGQFMEFAWSLCVYLKNGFPVHKTVIDTCLNNMENVAL